MPPAAAKSAPHTSPGRAAAGGEKSGIVLKQPERITNVYNKKQESLLAPKGGKNNVVPPKTLRAQTRHMGFPLHTVFFHTHLLPLLVPVLDRNSDQHNSQPLYQIYNGGSVWSR